jgi:hypothetical protein
MTMSGAKRNGDVTGGAMVFDDEYKNRNLTHPTGDVEGLEPRAPYPFVRASFINALSEEGTREELVRYLQEQWNETCAVRGALRSANSRIAELREAAKGQLVVVNTANARAEAVEARVAELEKALEPFAELAGGFDAHIYNDEKWPLLFKDEDHPVDDRGPTIGALRRARAALSTGTGEEKP